MLILIMNFPNYFVDNTYMLCVKVGFEVPNLITFWSIIKVDFHMKNLTLKIKFFILCVVIIIANNIDQNLKVERTTKSEIKIGKM